MAAILKEFEALGTSVANAWSRAHFGEHVLPDIAADQLSSSAVLSTVDWTDIVTWATSTAWLAPQINLDSNFGEPPLAVFWHPRFFIEVLFWTTGSPAIHEHGFSGAFGVLAGSSLQSRFAFNVTRRINANMILGDLVMRDVKLLRNGDIEPIRAGQDLIHSTFHLDTPSVTLVIRTPGDSNYGHPQYVYYGPHLAINDRLKDPDCTRRLQLIDFLDRIDSVRFTETVAEVLTRSDLYMAFNLLKYLRFSQRGMARFGEWAALARQSHGDVVDQLITVVERLDREMVIRSRRRLVLSNEHRLFLALLMNVPSRESILRLVAELYPAADPVVVVTEWAFELSGTDMCGIEFNQLNREVFTHLVRGLPIREVVAKLEDVFEVGDDIQRRLLADHCAEMRDNAIFRPLMQEAVAAEPLPHATAVGA